MTHEKANAMVEHTQIRRHALKNFNVGTVFNVQGWPWVLICCEPEKDGNGNKLTLKMMTNAEEALWRVMIS
jgi:hypothetical protein